MIDNIGLYKTVFQVVPSCSHNTQAKENIPLFSLVEKVLDLGIIQLLEVVKLLLDLLQESLLILRCKLSPSKL